MQKVSYMAAFLVYKSHAWQQNVSNHYAPNTSYNGGDKAQKVLDNIPSLFHERLNENTLHDAASTLQALREENDPSSTSMNDKFRPVREFAMFLLALKPGAVFNVFALKSPVWTWQRARPNVVLQLPARDGGSCQLMDVRGAACTDSPSSVQTDPRQVLPTRVRYAARVMYDGTSFNGFQFQPSQKARTVQSEIEKALATILREVIRVSPASRTDTGVHALGQCVHFDVPVAQLEKQSLTPGRLEFRANCLMPDDVHLYNVAVAPEFGEVAGLPWHSQVCARSKLYVYHFTTAQHPSVLRRHTQAHYRKGKFYYSGEIDPSRLRDACNLFVGTHDFTSLTNKDRGLKDDDVSEAALNPVRTIKRIDLIQDGGLGEWRLELELDGALYKMVRNIVGTLWAYAGGLLTDKDIADIFEQRDRAANPAKTAPAHGLTLVKVYYDDYD